ncbi:MAG TPA: DUF4349 domain-containing protein [Candidatus Udaeobacter sp.]|nr:DUF4349 domain-containing protein [Candidatus Udaeobacter sp.]
MFEDKKKLRRGVIIGLEALGISVLLWVVFYFTGGKRFLVPHLNYDKMAVYTDSSGYGSVQQGYGMNSGIIIPEPAIAPPVDMVNKSRGLNNESISRETVLPVSTDRKVVKNGSVSMLVKKADESAEKIKRIAGEFNGFVDGVNIEDISETSKFGTITIRVPADNFDKALGKIKELAIKVDSEQVKATDITEEFVDLEARLKNLKAQEAQYLKILDQAKKIDDILNVSNNLSYVRGEIERLEGRMRYLSDQVDMSSITASLTEEADVQLFGIRWRPLFSLKQGVRDMLSGLKDYADSVLSFIFLLPVLIVWLVTFAIGLWLLIKIYRLIKNKFFYKFKL